MRTLCLCISSLGDRLYRALLRVEAMALAMGVGLVCIQTAATAQSAEPAPTPEPLADFHRMAETLWNEYAPEAVKAEYELVPREEWLGLFSRLSAAGEQEDLQTFASFAPEARAALGALREVPEFADLTDWLGARLDEMELAEAFLSEPAPASPTPTTPTPLPTPAPTVPPTSRTPLPAPKSPAPPTTVESRVPLFGEWMTRLKTRPAPTRAATYLAVAGAAFSAAKVPAELVWLAETESSFNPRARSPVGAKGLFQIMPATARSLGLSLSPRDERTDPKRSAEAAAAYLHKLYQRFGDWPLTLAAYNAGEGRVSRTLAAQGAKDFAGIVDKLPAETRLYVPKVLATVQTRTGVGPAALETAMRRE